MMERKNNIIIALLGIWFLSMVGVFLLVNSYIDNQRTELRDDLRDGVKALFENQDDADVLVTDGDGFYDTAFSNHQVRHYKPTENPLRPKTPVKATKLSSSSIDKKVLDLIKDADEQLKQQYGDLQAIYELNWGDQFLNEYDEGWNIIRIYCSDNDNENFIQTNTIFPYKVGLRKSEFGNTFTVQDAVDGAYQFFTTNERSFISNRYQKDSNRRIWDDIYDCCNKYYTIVRNDNPTIQSNGTPISQPKGMSYDVAARKMPYELTSMQNGFYRVFIAATQPTTYKIQEDKEMVDKDRNNLFLWWGISLSVVFLVPVIVLSVKQGKSIQRKDESLYQRLVRVCNPKLLMKDYNKEKMSKAITLYNELVNTKPDDYDALCNIEASAINELGVSLINSNELEELKKRVNPVNFFNPYNSRKAAMANELYSILLKPDLTYKEFMDVKEKSDDLYK